MLLDEASENVELYNVEEKKELLFCIFEHLCLGGAVNQFEVCQNTKCRSMTHLLVACILHTNSSIIHIVTGAPTANQDLPYMYM